MGSAVAKAPTVVVLSEEEKALRRERLSAAAQDRSKSWDKKLGQKKPSQSLNVPIVDGNAVEAEAAGSSRNGTHADTERAIRKTKELEVRIEQVSTRVRSCQFLSVLYAVISMYICTVSYLRQSTDDMIPTASKWDTTLSGHTCPSPLGQLPPPQLPQLLLLLGSLRPLRLAPPWVVIM